MKPLNLVLAAAGIALLGGALAKELRKPATERTWTGRVIGIPYDFRPPTPAKIRRALWDPDNPSLLTPHVFGVGFGVNLARVFGRRGRRDTALAASYPE